MNGGLHELTCPLWSIRFSKLTIVVPFDEVATGEATTKQRAKVMVKKNVLSRLNMMVRTGRRRVGRVSGDQALKGRQDCPDGFIPTQKLFDHRLKISAHSIHTRCAHGVGR